MGAIYDPQKDAWTMVAPPSGWATIGDAPATVLADGRFLLGNATTNQAAVLDPATLKWSPISGSDSGGGRGSSDVNEEEGWTLLPSGNVLTVNTHVGVTVPGQTEAELFDTATLSWSDIGSTWAVLQDVTRDFEIGPAVLRPDGTVLATGALGHNAIYYSATGLWLPAPDFPVAPEGQVVMSDSPATLLPSGHVLAAASPIGGIAPTYFFEFSDAKGWVAAPVAPTATKNTGGTDPTNASRVSLLLLPTGEVLACDMLNSEFDLYDTVFGRHFEWAPLITTAPATVTAGKSYPISGVRFNGMSQGTYLGDDVQAATNYPLVRITNGASGHVRYARTHDHSSMAVASPATVTTTFDVPATAEPGPSLLEVVANGIASRPFAVTVNAP
jgi:hypothetical protein